MSTINRLARLDVALDRRPALGLGILALAAAVGAFTVGAALLPDVQFVNYSPQIDLLIHQTAVIVATAAAWLSWLRYRHSADQAAAYQAVAFALFAVLAAVQLLAGLGIAADSLQLTVTAAGQAPLYSWTLTRIIAALLLLLAGRAYTRDAAAPVDPRTVVGVPMLIAVFGCAYFFVFEAQLPSLVEPEALAMLTSAADIAGPLPGITALDVALQAAAATLFVAAAIAYGRAANAGRLASGRYIAAGLILAAFSQAHFLLFPGIFVGLVSTDDILRLCFYGFVVVGIQAEAGATLRRLRLANRDLEDLREAEVARATLAERTRLAREVHDGLAQNLWLAKLATERLGKSARRRDVDSVRAELDSLLDAGIAEARQTVLALRDAGTADPFLDVLERYVRRYGDETGLTVRLELGGPEVSVPPRIGGELLRITQEALNNVRRHADATVVTVSLGRADDVLTLAIHDNGVGFDDDHVAAGYGRQSMRERAEIVGGALAIDSAPGDGTTVRAEIPIPAGPVAA